MGKAYSQDVRVRVLAALDGGMSKMAVHRTFRISRSTIDDWVAVRATPGHLRPHAPARRGPPPAIAELKAFPAFMHQHNDATLAQLAQAWKQATGRQLRRNPLSLVLRRMGWTRKKGRCLRRARRRPTRSVSAARERDCATAACGCGRSGRGRHALLPVRLECAQHALHGTAAGASHHTRVDGRCMVAWHRARATEVPRGR